MKNELGAARTFRRWCLKALIVTMVVVGVMAIAPMGFRQYAIPFGYAAISAFGLAAALALFRLSWIMLAEDDAPGSARFSFCVGAVLLCESCEQGWWLMVRLVRYTTGVKPWHLYDHYLIAAWTVGLAVSIFYLLLLILPRSQRARRSPRCNNKE